MATNLYETLEISSTATPEQIRKAYKRKALQTHPDRLPPGATPEDKAVSEELFRKVNNAYEVLNDTQKRRMYDLRGSWPPPEPESLPPHRRSGESHYRSSHNHHHSSRNPFADPFFRNPDFVFTDPFTLFDSIFGNLDAPHNSSHFYHHHNHAGPSHAGPFERSRRMHSEFDNHGLFPISPSGFFGIMNFPSPEPMSFSDSHRGGWASESFMTTSVNGVTQTIHKRRDWDGTEHITRTYPDGREVRTINGVEQPSSSHGYIAQRPGSSEPHHRAQPGSASQVHITGSRTAGPTPPSYPPPPYTSQPRATGYPTPRESCRPHGRITCR
ncbi:DnaJ-domain-containing protein [Tricholoma matsutake]|nr:DnaJ-domain-containing protein [Tricholoma matsutake 945]